MLIHARFWLTNVVESDELLIPVQYAMMLIIQLFASTSINFARDLRHCANYAANYITFCPSELTNSQIASLASGHSKIPYFDV